MQQSSTSKHRWRIFLGAIVVTLAGSAWGSEDRAEELRLVREILAEVPLIDGHNDVPWQYRTRVGNHLERIDFRNTTDLEPPMHTDLRRLERSGIGGQFWSVYIPADLDGPGAARSVLEQIDVVYRLAAKYPDSLELAFSADDVERIHGNGKLASLIGMEGGHSIESSLAVLRQLFRAGARYMTLTHSQNIAWADSATDDPALGGLSSFGKEVVREMNRIGMLVDLSHVSAETMNDALDVSESPVIFSHSSAYAVTPHPRNVPDQVLRRLPANGGVVMVTFVPNYVNNAVRQVSEALSLEQERLLQMHPGDSQAIEEALQRFRAKHPPMAASLDDVADHIEHIRDVAGIDHIGIGSDFDGITSVPRGLEDVTRMPDLLAELLSRGFTANEVKKVCGLNVLRAMRATERTAQRLQGVRPASEATLEELDGLRGGAHDFDLR